MSIEALRSCIKGRDIDENPIGSSISIDTSINDRITMKIRVPKIILLDRISESHRIVWMIYDLDDASHKHIQRTTN